VAAAADCLLIGFWEEFAFRGLVQERLRVLGPRVGVFVTAVLFGLIHVSEGVPAVLIAAGIGLAFGVARDAIGLWPLVGIHATIDFMTSVFLKRWEHQFAVGASLVAVYSVVALVVLMRRREPEGGAGPGGRPPGTATGR
jgi:membrane protease YdiL (CAAX protease family)